MRSDPRRLPSLSGAVPLAPYGAHQTPTVQQGTGQTCPPGRTGTVLPMGRLGTEEWEEHGHACQATEPAHAVPAGAFAPDRAVVLGIPGMGSADLDADRRAVGVR